MDNVPTLQLTDGQVIPQVGLGTWMLTGRACVKVIKDAYALGYRHFDTATTYKNEADIGSVIKTWSRSELFLTSKVFINSLNYNLVKQACWQSLKDLKTDYLDLYLIHWPNKKAPLLETFQALAELQQAGQIRSIGISNFTIKHLQETLPITSQLNLKLVTNQVEFHPGLYQKELLEFCQKNNIIVTAYSPLGQGGILDNPTISRLASKYKKTSAQICLIWLINKGLAIVPKAITKQYLQENLKIFDLNLEPADAQAIDEIGSDQRLVNPDWAEFNDYK